MKKKPQLRQIPMPNMGEKNIRTRTVSLPTLATKGPPMAPKEPVQTIVQAPKSVVNAPPSLIDKNLFDSDFDISNIIKILPDCFVKQDKYEYNQNSIILKCKKQHIGRYLYKNIEFSKCKSCFCARGENSLRAAAEGVFKAPFSRVETDVNTTAIKPGEFNKSLYIFHCNDINVYIGRDSTDNIIINDGAIYITLSEHHTARAMYGALKTLCKKRIEMFPQNLRERFIKPVIVKDPAPRTYDLAKLNSINGSYSLKFDVDIITGSEIKTLCIENCYYKN